MRNILKINKIALIALSAMAFSSMAFAAELTCEDGNGDIAHVFIHEQTATATITIPTGFPNRERLLGSYQDVEAVNEGSQTKYQSADGSFSLQNGQVRAVLNTGLTTTFDNCERVCTECKPQ